MLDIPPDYLEQFRAAYPKRDGDQGWMAVRTLIPRMVNQGFTWARILAGAVNYATYCRNNGKTGTGYVKQAKTFVGPDAWFEEWADKDVRPEAEIAADNKRGLLQSRADALGVTIKGMDYPTAEAAIVKAEREALNQRWEKAGMNAPKFQVVK